MLTNNKQEKRRNNLLVFLLLFISGNPLAVEHPILEYKYIVIALILIIYTANLKRRIINKDATILYVVTLIIFFLQIVTLHYFSYPAAINFLSIATCGILIVRIIGPDFKNTYLNVMYFLCTISIIGQILYIIGLYPGISINEGNFKTIIFHNVKVRSLILGNEFNLRNSGMFWEPGAFQGYIILTYLMYVNNLKELWTIHKIKFIVITIALITTFSTTAYIALAVLVLYAVLSYSKNSVLRIVFSVVVVFASLYMYKTTEFLGEKISSEINYIDDGRISVGRIGSASFDFHYIKKHPIIGNSLHNATRYSDHLWFDRLRSFSNGFTDIIAKMGLFFILIYFILVYKRWHNRKIDKLFTIIMMIILLQGECFFNFPLFFALPFIKLETNRLIK